MEATAADYLDARRLLAAQALRQIEGMKLYQPMPTAAKFHNSSAPERIVRGSNRAGKTLAAAAEVAMAVTGSHPDRYKYPEKNGIAYCIGRSGREIAQKIWPSLGKPGAFRMIRDLKTDNWRVYDPSLEEDRWRKEQSRPSLPLIPKRLIKSIAWYTKKEGWPKLVTLTNGWILHFYSADGKPTQGTDIDLVWFDEEVTDPDWYNECAARLVDRRGKFIWSATPQAGTERLYGLHLRAEEEEEEKIFPRSVEEYYVTISENKYISQEDKDTFAKKFSDNEAETAIRIRGEYALLTGLVYNDYSQREHEIDPPPSGTPPPNWTKYFVVDPGIQVCAVLFAAISPPEEGDFCDIYDELYIRDSNVQKFGQGMRGKAEGMEFRAALIDMHEGRKRDHTGMPVWMQYSAALKDVGVGTELTGHEFLPGNDNVAGGIMAVKSWLRIRADGTRKIRVYRTCKNFSSEARHYRNQKDPTDKSGNTFVDKPVHKKDHLMDCFDSETDVLTDSGWKRFANLEKNDRLATVHLESNRIEYQWPDGIVAKRYSGDMIRFGGHKLDGLVTPNHRMVVYPRYGDGPVIKNAGDVTIWDKIKLHADWHGEDHEVVLVERADRGTDHQKELDPGDWAEFLGWYVAEGCAASTVRMPGHGYSVVVSQKHGEKRNRLKRLLDKLPWHWNENDHGFYASSKQLWHQVRFLGDAYTKVIPTWIRWASTPIIKRFLSGAVDGDGWTQAGRRAYATVSRSLADQMQELFVKCGVTASILNRDPKPYCIKGRRGDNVVEQHHVHEWVKPHGLLRDSRNKPNFETIAYEGMVYCATVPNGTLIVRRNGKPMIAGNCLRYLVQFQPIWVPPRNSQRDIGVYAWYQREKAKQNKGGLMLGPTKRDNDGR